MDKREFDVFELIRIILQHRVFIIIFVAIVSVAAVIYALLTPKIWESRASFYIVGDQATSMPIDIPGLSSIASGLLDSNNLQSSVTAVSAMKSRRFSEDVIRHFNLIRYYNIADPDSLVRMDLALMQLENNMVRISLSDDTGLIGIRVESKDKKLSRDIANYYIERLDVYNREQKLTRGKRNREFLELRVLETRATLDSLITADKDFRKKNNAVDIEAQTSALIQSYSDVISSKMGVDIELELARKNYSEDSPLVADLKTKSAALGKQIRDMESSGGNLKPRYLIDIAALPDLGSRYAQLKMNMEIQSKVFEFLYPQYEAARLEELRDMPSVDVLDTPRESGLRLRPKRAMICIIAAMMAFIAAVVIVLIKAVIVRNKDRLLEIRKSL
jgi:uncharacterized protein involved in exopolysaccharide biosynthesis